MDRKDFLTMGAAGGIGALFSSRAAENLDGAKVAALAATIRWPKLP